MKIRLLNPPKPRKKNPFFNCYIAPRAEDIDHVERERVANCLARRARNCK